jgi:hypothetical protein
VVGATELHFEREGFGDSGEQRLADRALCVGELHFENVLSDRGLSAFGSGSGVIGDLVFRVENWSGVDRGQEAVGLGFEEGEPFELEKVFLGVEDAGEHTGFDVLSKDLVFKGEDELVELELGDSPEEDGEKPGEVLVGFEVEFGLSDFDGGDRAFDFHVKKNGFAQRL